MSSYTFTSEQAKQRTITTIEEARRVIIATATTRMHTYEDLMKDPDLVTIADTFGIALSDVIVEPSVDPNDFPFTYSFK